MTTVRGEVKGQKKIELPPKDQPFMNDLEVAEGIPSTTKSRSGSRFAADYCLVSPRVYPSVYEGRMGIVTST